MRSLLARLVSAEVRRLTAQLAEAREQRSHARRIAVRWYREARGG